ncbi:hypothetical protein ZIOFF_047643 [Zingiber officinale]|uniref:SPX domain-containing protein n=1 Tax=Zingiber officinale TaxID=94328 RepID=A0A8J5KVX7_ZINOF|nr:hypothetical protein ZIOFF_047643 [Zingiber officinale]
METTPPDIQKDVERGRGSTNGTSYDDMVFIPVVRTEERVTPVTPPPAAPTMAVLSPLPSSFPAPVEITHATNATTSAASSIAGDSINIPAIAVVREQPLPSRKFSNAIRQFVPVEAVPIIVTSVGSTTAAGSGSSPPSCPKPALPTTLPHFFHRQKGLVKILKKYDKRTGALIRQPFIEKVLQQPFFTTDLLYKLVKECVAMLDHLFPSNNLSISAECDGQNGVPKPAQSGGRVPELEEIKYMQSLYMKSTVASLRSLKQIRSKSSSLCKFILLSSCFNQESRRVNPEIESSNCPTVASKKLLLRDKQLLDQMAWGHSDNSRPSSLILTITESIYS